jgi:5-methylcytosine-specific restriction endonuclease McrA
MTPELEVLMFPHDTAEKVCTVCGLPKPRAEFSKDAQKKDGLRPNCKACHRASRAEYDANYRLEHHDRVLQAQAKHREQNRDRISARARAERLTNGEHRRAVERKSHEKHREQKHAYEARRRAENPERERARLATFRKANREQLRQRRREVYRQNIEHYRLKRRQEAMLRQARKLAASVEVVDYRAIWERDQGICYLCGGVIGPSDVHYDHVVPLSKGGAHSMANIRATHSLCNLSKADRTVEEYLAAKAARVNGGS